MGFYVTIRPTNNYTLWDSKSKSLEVVKSKSVKET